MSVHHLPLYQEFRERDLKREILPLGLVNQPDLYNWALDKPKWLKSADKQHCRKLNIWRGIIGYLIVGPHILSSNVLNINYSKFLENSLPSCFNRKFNNGNRSEFVESDGQIKR